MDEIRKSNGSIYDEHPGLKRFVDNYTALHPEADSVDKNLYVIQTIDRSGKITGEYYGMNLVTDVGSYILNQNPYSIHFAWDLVELDPARAADHSDVNYPSYKYRLVNTSSTQSDQIYTCAYNSSTGIIRQDYRYGTVEFDYNYSGVEEDVNVDCIVYRVESSSGGQYENIPIIEVTPYGDDGMASSFVKHVDEKIIMTVYYRGTIHENVLIDGYANGQYVVLNPGRLCRAFWRATDFVFRIRSLSGRGRASTFPVTTSSGSSSSTATVVDLGIKDSDHALSSMANGEHAVWAYSRMKVISDPRTYCSRAVVEYGWDASYWRTDNAFIHYREIKLPTPETITWNSMYTNSFQTGSLYRSFGVYFFETSWYRGTIPVVDFSISSVKGYNYTTHDWDIDIPFINAPDAYYDSPFSTDKIDFGLDPKGWGCFIYTNPRAKDAVGRPSVGVTRLDQKSSGTLYPMYATDKYWDPDSWEQIQDISAIPANLQKKKYYISYGGDNGDLTPVYDQTSHSLNVGTTYNVQNAPTDFMKNTVVCFKTISDETNGWILTQEHLLFMNGKDVQYSYKLSGPEYFTVNYDAQKWSANWDKYYKKVGNDYVLNDDSTYSSGTTYYSNRIDPLTIRYGFGNKILVASDCSKLSETYPTGVRIYSISSASTAPTYQDVQIDTNTTSRSSVGGYSASSNGFFVIYCDATSCANIITISDGSVVKLENVKYCFALEYTDYCIYKDTTETGDVFKVYNMRTNQIVGSFIFDASTYGTITYVTGWHEYFYIRSTGNDQTFVNMYNVLTDTLSVLSDVSFTYNGFLTNTSTSTAANETSNIRLNYFGQQLYHHDVMILPPLRPTNTASDTTSYIAIKYDEPEKSFEIFKKGSVKDRYIEKDRETNTYYTLKGGFLAPSLIEAVQSQQQSKLLLINTASDTCQYNNRYTIDTTTTSYCCVSDIGPIIDSGSKGNMCYAHGTTSDTTIYHGGLAYCANGIIRFTDSDAVWYPLEWFIHSTVTGTTYTIQAMNNPKKLGNIMFAMYKSNRGEVQHNIIRSSGDLNYVFKVDYHAYGWSEIYGYKTMQMINAEIIGPNQLRQSVPAGSTITVTVTPNSNFSFLDGTFEIWLTGFTIKETDSAINTTTNLRTNKFASGEPITIDTAINCLGITIASTYSSGNFSKALPVSAIDDIHITYSEGTPPL